MELEKLGVLDGWGILRILVLQASGAGYRASTSLVGDGRVGRSASYKSGDRGSPESA